MLRILKSYGIPHNCIQAISLTYKYTYEKVITPDGETEKFQITKGVLQGDTLKPFLFVITLDYAMRQYIDGREAEFRIELIQRQGRRHPAIQLTYLINNVTNFKYLGA